MGKVGCFLDKSAAFVGRSVGGEKVKKIYGNVKEKVVNGSKKVCNACKLVKCKVGCGMDLAGKAYDKVSSTLGAGKQTLHEYWTDDIEVTWAKLMKTKNKVKGVMEDSFNRSDGG